MEHKASDEQAASSSSAASAHASVVSSSSDAPVEVKVEEVPPGEEVR
jgi:hypothetical protein